MKIKVNKEILIWARQELNLSRDILAQRLEKNVEDIQAWEEGIDYPIHKL